MYMHTYIWTWQVEEEDKVQKVFASCLGDSKALLFDSETGIVPKMQVRSWDHEVGTLDGPGVESEQRAETFCHNLTGALISGRHVHENLLICIFINRCTYTYILTALWSGKWTKSWLRLSWLAKIASEGKTQLCAVWKLRFTCCTNVVERDFPLASRILRPTQTQTAFWQ